MDNLVFEGGVSGRAALSASLKSASGVPQSATHPATRSFRIGMVGSLLVSAVLMTSPSLAAEVCPCFSADDIVQECRYLAPNAQQEGDRYLSLNCRTPVDPSITRQFTTGAYAVANGVAVDWYCAKTTIPDDGSGLSHEDSKMTEGQEQACRQNMATARQSLPVRDDPQRLQACATKCAPETIMSSCRAFWTTMDDLTEAELKEELGMCDGAATPARVQNCTAECV